MNEEELKLAAMRSRFVQVVEIGAKLGFWITDFVSAIPAQYDWRASATVIHKGRAFRLIADLRNGTVTAYNVPIEDAEGRAIIPRDVLPYNSLAPKEPKASLARDPDVVARDLAKRCVNNPSWEMLIDLMVARRNASVAYSDDKEKTLVEASKVLRGRGISQHEHERGEFTHYPDGGPSYDVRYSGEGKVRIRIDAVDLAQFTRIVRLLRDRLE